MVIIILVSDSSDALDIEVRELGSNPRWKTRNTPTTSPTATNKLQIKGAANANPANASFPIPYAVIFDNDHRFAADIVFSHVQLSKIANHIFRHTSVDMSVKKGLIYRRNVKQVKVSKD